jgi:Ankyrin repeats (3 copies)
VSCEICVRGEQLAYNQVRFLLARLYLDSLLDKSSKKKILSTLAELPRGSEALDEAYNDAIKRIEGQLSGHRTLAINVLSWITYAQRPLTTGELCHALAVESGESELDLDNIPDIDDMVSVCAGLVIVDDESNIIRLVHYTTQEYFERIRESWNPRAQQEIASACLTYLSFDSFKSGSCLNNEEFESRLKKNVFLDYASRYWGQHIRTVQEQVYKLASSFVQDITLVSCAVQTMSISEFKYGDYSQRFPRHTTGLHLTTSFGLLYLLERLLSEMGRNIDVVADSKDDFGRTPLWWAAQRGHEAVVKLLVARDDVAADSNDNDGRTPLSGAAGGGHEAVVKLLVARDDVAADSKDKLGRTPLSGAAEGGHEAVVKLLRSKYSQITNHT